MKKVSGLKKILSAGMIGLASLLPMKNANAQQIVVNPFVQPNQSDLNWYGSGDVNNDNAVNWNDVSRLDSIVDGTYVPNLNSSDPAEYRALDRADVNGDGAVDSLDKKILEDKLNSKIDYMPGEWDKLESNVERENLHKQRHSFQWNDKLDTIEYIPEEFDCDNFGRLNMRDFKGFPEMSYDKESGWRDNGRYNLPEFYVEIFYGGVQSHVVTGAVVGDSIDKLDCWDIRDRNGLKYGEDIAFPENCEIVIKDFYVKENEVQGKYLSPIPVVKFNVTGGSSEFAWMNDDPNVKIYTTRPTVDTSDKIPPEINLKNPVPDSTYKGEVLFDYKLIDKNLDLENSYYELNGVKKYFSDSTGSIYLDSKKGSNKLEVFATDKFGNDANKVVNYNFSDSSTSSDKDKNLEKILSVYPNPVSQNGILNFDYENPLSKDVYLEVYNVAGQLVGKENSNSSSIDYNVSNLSSGVYIYSLKDSEKIIGTGKFVRE